MSIKSAIPNCLKAYAKELLGIGRLEREIKLRSSTYQSTHARLTHLENRMAPLPNVQAEIDLLSSAQQSTNVLIKLIEDRVECLESVASFTKNIDLGRVDDFFHFVYEGDLAHRVFPSDAWGQQTKLSPAEISSRVAEARRSKARRDLYKTDAVARSVWSLAKSDQPVNLIYVGCNYGFHLMKLADFIVKQNLNCRIVAFDPGVAGTLAAPTFRLNHLHNIEFFNVAVSSADSYAIMQQIVGHSEDNKLVNIVDSPLRLSRLVETVTLDAFCAQHRIVGPTVLVIDTQGNEPDVIAGAERFIKNNVCVIVSEFTPWALNERMRAQDYLLLLATYGDVYNLGVVEHQAEQVDGNAPLPSLLHEKVTAENRDAFSKRIFGEPPYWTDVLVIPGDRDLGPLVAEDFNVANFPSSNECAQVSFWRAPRGAASGWQPTEIAELSAS